MYSVSRCLSCTIDGCLCSTCIHMNHMDYFESIGIGIDVLNPQISCVCTESKGINRPYVCQVICTDYKEDWVKALKLNNSESYGM